MILSIDSAIGELAALKTKQLTARTGWPPFKVFSHLGQSIEYSMTGYPAMKPVLFQQTVGRAVFFGFTVAGKMKHSLTAAIPGAPEIPETGNLAEAIDRVIASLANFDKYEGPLHPHFAYGKLSKAQYANAHLMHVENHLEDFAGNWS